MKIGRGILWVLLCVGYVLAYEECAQLPSGLAHQQGKLETSEEQILFSEDAFQWLTQSKAVILEQFIQTYGDRISLFQEFGKDHNPIWQPADILESYVDMYEKFKDVRILRILDKHLEFLVNGIDNRQTPVLMDELRNKSMPAWGVRDEVLANKRHVWLVHAGKLAYPMAAFARIVYLNPDLHREFKSRADFYKNRVLALTTAFNRDFRSTTLNGQPVGYYVFPKEFSTLRCEKISDLTLRQRCMNCRLRAGTQPLPFNMMFAAGRAMLELYQADPIRKYYEDRLFRMIAYFKSHLVLESSPKGKWYHWPYVVGGRMEDASHGSTTINFIQTAHQIGLGFDNTDMVRLSRTYITSMAQTDSKGTPTGLTCYLNGTDCQTSKASYSRACARWLPLAPANRQIFTHCLGVYRTNGYASDTTLPRAIEYAKFQRWKCSN